VVSSILQQYNASVLTSQYQANDKIMT